MPLDDLAPTAPVRINDQDAVIVDLAGAMRSFDLASGAVVWRHEIGSDVNVPPAVGSGVIVIMDRGGTTATFDQNTGKRQWYKEMQGSAAVTIDNTVAVIQDQTIHGLTADSGRHRWVRPIFGSLTDMATFADHIVVAT